MPDGKIVISTELDNKELESDLHRLNKKIASMEKELTRKKSERLPLAERAEQLGVELDTAKAKLYEMQTASSKAFSADQIADQSERVKSLQATWNGTITQAEKYDRAIASAEQKIRYAKEDAAEIGVKLAESAKKSSRLRQEMQTAKKNCEKFALQTRKLVKSFLLFSLLSKVSSALGDGMKKVIRTNKEASQAVAKLKGELLTLAQPLLTAVLPAFSVLVNLTTQAVRIISSAVSGLFGTTTEKAREAAKSMYEEASAISATGSAAKKASKSMAAFDEINQLGGGASDTASDGIVPDFSGDESNTDSFLNKMAEDVLMIATGFALWQISSSLPGILGLIGTKIGLIAVFVASAILLWESLSDAWNNGVDWGNLLGSLGGLVGLAVSLYMLFGKTTSAVGLLVGGFCLMVTAMKDIGKNGFNLKNTLMLLAGIFAGGLGLSVLLGSWIPLLIAAIAGILVAITAAMGNGEELIKGFKQALSGLTDFIQGVFAGDWEKAWNGLKKAFEGIWHSINVVFYSVVNLVIKGMNKLIDKINDLLEGSLIEKGLQLFGVEQARIGHIAEIPIPKLATGAVIPPNREFLAVLGDQRSGTNIEAPLATIEQAVENVLSRRGGDGGGSQTLILECDKVQFAKLVYRANKSESHRIGVSLVEV